MISITEKAANRVKEISDADAVGHYIIRVKCLGGGCAGFQFDLSFDDQISDMDEIFEMDGVKIICDQMSFQYLDETSIDYVEELMGSGFKFNVPRAKGSCGCGSSFDF
jgi:iron-sulfur cluster insertion protein